MTGSHTLLLNASFEPLHIVSWQRALQLLFQGKVEVIETSDREVRTVRLSIRVPTVLRLLQYAPVRMRSQFIRLSRANVFLRDRMTCQYCGRRSQKQHLTLDHVTPLVQKGPKSWTNIVTSCKPCNQRKGGRTPQQASMRLLREPREPDWLPFASIQIGVDIVPDRWRLYLQLKGP